MQLTTTVVSGSAFELFECRYDASGEGLVNDPVVETELAWRETFRVDVHPQPVQRRHRIRGIEFDPHLRVEHDDAIADTGDAVLIVLLAPKREFAGGNHVSEPLEQCEVSAFEIARRTTEHRQRFSCQYCDSRATVAYRYGLDAYLVQPDQLQRVVTDLARLERLVDRRALGRPEQLADEVGAIDRLRGRGADVTEQDQLLVVGAGRGANNKTSLKLRSASSPHDRISRCKCAVCSERSERCSRTSSANDATT